MAHIQIRRGHNLGREAARARIEDLAPSLMDRLEARWFWDGDTLNFERSGASGCVNVGDDYVAFDLKLGMLLSAMKGSIEDAVHEKLEQTLA